MPTLPGRRSLIVFLGALVAIGPLSIDMYLPSLPEISADLATTPDTTHLTVSTFLLGFCLGMLVYGPLSDQLGRRPLVLTGLAVFTLASAGCLLVNDVHALVGLRFVQALGGGAAAVLGRAVVRDVFAPSEAARTLSLMQAVTMLAPLFAPIVGGYVAEWFSWRAVFAVLTVYGGLCLALVALKLPESLAEADRSSGGLASAMRSYRTVLSDRHSLALVMAGAWAFAGMFAYITASPFVYIEHFGVQPRHYGYLFGLNILGILSMALLNARLVQRLPAERVLLSGAAVACIAGVSLTAVTLLQVGGLPAVVTALFFYVGVTGLIGANCIALLLARHRKQAGTATAAFGVTQFGLGALVSACVGLVQGPESLGVLVGACGSLSIASAVVACVPKDTPEPAQRTCPGTA